MTTDPGSPPVFTRGLARIGVGVGVGAFALLMFGGCLIPFTAGVSVVLMIPSLIGWPVAALIGWRGVKALPKDDPVRPWAQASLLSGLAGLILIGGTLGLLLLSILMGVAIAELDPGFTGRIGH